jgi:hypothetical protein
MVDYTFPNISFNTSIIGPAPARPGWRDKYAVIGEFNRGPVVPVNSSNRAVLASLYGEDTSSGSIALQQAFRQGATNAVVARAVPDSLASQLYFELSGQSTFIQPSTGYESSVANTGVLDSFNSTTGFKLTLDYIGRPKFNRTNYGGVESKNTPVDHPTFAGRAQMTYMVTRVQSADSAQRVVYEDDNEELEITLHNSTRDDYQLVTYEEGNNEYVEQYIKPGFTIRSSTSAQQEGLVIASNPFTYGEGVKAVLVKGHYSPDVAYTANIVSASGLYTLTVSDFQKGSAAESPSLPILAESVALVAGTAYKVDATASNGPNIDVTLASNVTAAASSGAPVSFVPRVSAVALNGGNTEITLTGVLANTDVVVGSKVSFSSKENAYEVATIPTVWSSGSQVISITGDVRATAKVGDYVLVTSADATAQIDTFKVHFPAKTQYILGYNFRPLDSGSLASKFADYRYFTVGTASAPVQFYDGFVNYPVDSYLVIEEGKGGSYLKIPYQTALANVQEAQLLKSEYFGLELRFGKVNDTKVYLVENNIFNVSFVKTEVVVGGKAGSETAYPKGTVGTTILRDLEYAIYSDAAFSSMIADVKTDISLVPYKFTVNAGFVGVDSNRLRWNLERYVAGPTGVFSSKASNVVTLDAVPDVVLANPTDYKVVIADVEYPVASATSTTVTLTLTDVAVLDAYAAGDTVQFASQEQTKDILIRRGTTGDFDVTDYGTDKFYAFTGGRDTASHAYADFYALNGKSLLRVVALNPGVYGNNLKVTIIPDQISADSAKFYLQVEDVNPNVTLGGPKTELWYLDNKQVDANTGVYQTTKDSNLIRAYFLPAVEPINITNLFNIIDEGLFKALPLRIAPPLESQDSVYASGATKVSAQGSAYISSVKLSGGTEFVDPDPAGAVKARKDGYLAALRAIEKEDVAWVVIAGIYYGDNDYREVFEELKAQCERSTTLNGLRRGVVNLAPNVAPRQASVLRDLIASDKIVQVAGSIQGVNLNGQVYQNQGSAGIYVGLRCARPPHISTPSTYASGSAYNVTFSNINSSPDVLDAFTRAGTEVIFYDSGLKLYKFLNGVTTSKDPNKKYVCVLEVWDQMKSDLYDYLQWVRSEPNTRDLQRRVSSSVDAYLQDKFRSDWFIRIAPTICGPENNSEADMIRGQLNITVRATPTFPADFIKVNAIMDLSETFSLDTQPISSF